MKPSVSIVVPNVVRQQLQWFFEQNWAVLQAELERGELQLLIVTSAIGESELATWRRNYPGAQWTVLKQNHGFASTVNIGLRLATAQWRGTMNDDVIWTKGWWQACLAVADTKTGSMNPIIVDPHGGIESAGITVACKGKAEPVTDIAEVTRAKQTWMQTDATNGACVLYRDQVLEKVGLFDERFGSYLEDIDLSLRISKAGYTNLVCLTTRVTHLKHASRLNSRTKAWHDCKNWWLLILKHWTLQKWLHCGPQLLLERGRNLSGLLKAMSS